MSTIDQQIVKAAIYPAIGVARVGNSRQPDGYFVGPEDLRPENRPASYYKDNQGALKRQAARFRVYGLNRAGQVVQELTATNAKITWQVHVANKKAAGYEFNVAMDIPQAQPVPLRNANFTGADRAQLIIDGGAVQITGINASGPQYAFDKGQFIGKSVYLGELRTDEKGHLLFLGGHGLSASAFPNNPPTTFANNNGWHDDTSDGPVDATVTYEGVELPVEGAWVVTAPPNYAPDIVSVQTMFDVITDALSGMYIAPKKQPSFQGDLLPLFQQFSQNQWVNQGFYVAYGFKQPYDFTAPEFIRRLAVVTKDADGKVTDEYAEYRRQIFNYFRDPQGKQIEPQRWPWMYGDNMNVPATTANGYFTVTGTLYGYLQQWVKGNFAQDWDPVWQPPAFDQVSSPQAQADLLTKSALWNCLGGPFHPGCEMTWPIRLPGMYSGAFRIRRRSANNPEQDYGPMLSPDLFQNQNYFTTPISFFWNGPGDITRWMACPWQTDTASCRSGYEGSYDSLIPTFWAAHVPNQVLTEADYRIATNESLPREKRIEAFTRRASWYRILGANYLDSIQNMVDRFGDLGVVAYKPGAKPKDPLRDVLPPVMYVESVPFAAGGEGKETGGRARKLLASQVGDVPLKQGLHVGPVGKGAPRH